MTDEIERLRRRVERERAARIEAETIAERATRDLYASIGELEKFKAILDATPDLVVVVGLDGTVQYANESARRVLGWSAAANPRVRLHELYGRAARGRLRADVLPALRQHGVWSGELELQGAEDPRPIPVSQVVMTHPAGGRRRGYVAAIARDLSVRKSLEEQLAHQALHDPLTGLPNRLLFAERVERAASRRPGRGALSAVLFIDVDDFKTVNDSLGHAAGDTLLDTVAERITGATRTNDTTARLGGDEFAVLLDGIAHPAEAIHVADRILAAMREPCTIESRTVVVSGSIGIAVQPGRDWRADELLRNADMAMYTAKRNGKDRHEVFDPAMHDRVVERLELRADLRRAVEHGEFLLHYQPIVTLDDGTMTGFEALVRWEHPTRGTLSPADFLPLLEETGLIVDVGRWVLIEACTQLREWQDADPASADLSMSVNLSARQLQCPTLVDDVADCIAASRLDAGRLTLEITETALMRDIDEAARILGELKELGVRLAIDDFGTGYSSLSYLRAFPIDVIKIDRSFVSSIARHPSDLALVRSISDLAGALRVSTVAEGIEATDQADALGGLGCTLGQGYLYSRPLAAAAISDLLAEQAARIAGVSRQRAASPVR